MRKSQKNTVTRNRHNMHTILCNYVKANGPQTWTELHKVVLTVAGRNLNERNWGVAYLDFVSPSSAMFPSRNDSRYLVMSHVDGLYHLIGE